MDVELQKSYLKIPDEISPEIKLLFYRSLCKFIYFSKSYSFSVSLFCCFDLKEASTVRIDDLSLPIKLSAEFELTEDKMNFFSKTYLLSKFELRV
jgi:hypothetical protein